MLIISSAPVPRCPLGIIYQFFAKTILKALLLKINPTDKFKHQQDPEYVCKVKDGEFRWNLSIKTETWYNKPDIVAWNKQEKCVKFIEISCSADVNITKKVEENLNSYGPLIRNLQIMYAH